MEDILATQQQIIDAMESLYINFKKDPKDRKSKTDYFKRKLDVLNSYWGEFQSNHIKLCGFDDKSHEYFVNNVFEAVRVRYEYIMNQIKESKSSLSAPFMKPPVLKLGTGAAQQHEHVDEASRMQQPASAAPGTSRATDSVPVDSINMKESGAVPRDTSTLTPTPIKFKVKTSSHDADDDPSEQMQSERCSEKLIKQNSNFRALNRTLSSINLDDLSERWELEDCLKTLQIRWRAIDSLHWELDGELNGQNLEYEEAFSEYEQCYNEMKRAINKKMWSTQHREKSTPVLDIPQFHGNYHLWTSFKDLFMEAIHNNSSLSNAQKMQFLKSKVKGEAERLIQHLKVSSDNYGACWELLNNRYNNRKLIFSAHINIMLNLPSMQNQASINQIKRLHDVTIECLNAVKNLGIDTATWDPLLVHILSQKLDASTNEAYIDSLQKPFELPTLAEFLSFLEGKFRKMESASGKTKIEENITPQKSKISFIKPKNFNKNYQQSFTSLNKSSARPVYNKNNNFAKRCPICDTFEHALFYCPQFLEMDNKSKLNIINKHELCKNCLYCHFGKPCISEKRCQKCNSDHNTILHDAFSQGHQYGQTASRPTSSNIKFEPNRNKNTHVSLQRDVPPEVLLATAMLKVKSADGTYHTLRALIDQGSQTSLITEKAAQALRLSRSKFHGIISGVGTKESTCKGITKICCSSMDNNYQFETEVLIMKSLIKNLPSVSFNEPEWSFLNNIKLADPQFYISRPVDLLLGADIYSIILLEGICKQHENVPIAQQTQLGWILCGHVKTLQCNVTLCDIDEIKRFWEIEDITDTSQLSSSEEQVINFYQKTTRRLEDGRYSVRIPMKENFEDKLGTSKNKAVAQFRQLERKFCKNKQMESDYKAFIHEYLSLGHMKLSTYDGNMKPTFFLPHHSVTREESTTTKTRVVFNGSAPTSTGHSLNDLMECGPNLQQDLQTLIIKWRQYQIAFTADIEKMYRQIWVHEEDQNLQKIVWRDSPEHVLQEYQLRSVTYGLRSSPFLAMMTLRRLAADEKEINPNSMAADVIESCFYMDDVVHGCHTAEEAEELKENLMSVLQSGGFNLRKWKSNHLPISTTSESEQTEFDFKQAETSKTLGLSWNPIQDCFTFQSKIEISSEVVTKRSFLSDLSKIFDPIGWLSPLTTKLKIMFQQVFMSQIGWDDQLPKDLSKEWMVLREDIININYYQIQRWLGTVNGDEIELHGFCDASLKAYACVIYCKIKRGDHVSINQVTGKARLVPASSTKEEKVSLPRLELCGSLLLSVVMEKVIQCLSEDYKISVYGWCDSKIVLGWLQGEPARWKTFVANRVSKVVKTIPSDSWRYVASADNPADCASRGQSATELKNNALWWCGPEWLREFEKTTAEKETYQTDQEIKKIKQVNVTQQYNNDVINKVIKHFSSLKKVVRSIAWLKRFVQYLSNKHHKKQQIWKPYLSISELRISKIIIIKHTQQAEYSKEIDKLQSGQSISGKSKLLCLTPLLDEEGILRVGGRLKHANMHPDMKHPIIIPEKCRLSELIIDQTHKLTFHGGPKMTTGVIRQKYWIIGGYRVVKKQIRLCVKCRKHSPSKHQQLMGDLPEPRINTARPFYHTGVDYTGHLYVKASKGRGTKTSKGYVAVFVCMVTKAVHLELVSDLSTSAMLAALKRLSAKRGTPGHLYSDFGSCFIGADRKLKEEYEQIKETLGTEFMSEIADMNIEWHFQGPSWPSAGGLWESQVKQLKHHLKRVVGDQKLTFEEYSTLLAQLEACLNSRPLCPITEDPNELDCLTPSHFLASGPSLNVIETEEDHRSRWYHTQKIFNDIWRRWRNEYLTQLSIKGKWRSPQPNFKVGDIVIINDANLPAGKWPMGRILEVHPGKDGYVRVVTIKTKNGIIKRPIVKLSILPVEQNYQTINNQAAESDDSSNAQRNLPPTEQNKRPKRTIKKKKPFNLSLLVSALLLFFSLISNSECAYNYTTFKNNQSVYFDKISNAQLIRDEWRLIVYYDMNPYRDGLSTITEYLYYINKVCTKIRSQSHCEEIMLQLRHEFGEIKHYDGVLSNQQTVRRRRRRGLVNLVGNVANTLFGVLDSQFAEKYENDINLIKQNQNHLAMLWKNQTSIVEAEFNFIKRSEDIMDKHHKAINKRLLNLEQNQNNIQKDLNSISLINDFTMSAAITSNLIAQIKSMQNDLLDTITNIYHGKINLHLITPEQLQHELNIISSHLTKDLTLPGEDSNLAKIYHLLKTRAKLSKNYIIIEITIPLVTRDYYEILKIIPIPHQIQNNKVSIVPVSNYIAINLRKDTMIRVSQNELQLCMERDQSSIICNLRSPVYSIKSDEDVCQKKNGSRLCKTAVQLCDNEWIELSQINTYFYFCCDKCPIKLLCPDQITSLQLQSAGMFAVGTDCAIKSKELTLYSHNQKSNKLVLHSGIELPKMAAINHMFNITLPLENITTESISDQEHQQQLSEVQRQLDDMKQRVPLVSSSMSNHDIHHYVAVYGIVATLAIVGAAVAWRRACGGRQRARAPAAPAARPAAPRPGSPVLVGHSSVFLFGAAFETAASRCGVEATREHFAPAAVTLPAAQLPMVLDALTALLS
ncbi:unnamed protein product [Plutella xylostella]|uniref:(diamondback moth) hypothetical protein n=1 Tax=Plutella xylostella TaxID=51655 RepID=A0A8S4FHG9_PLUXY|nr:unnamed protein product [Plutella xylostella]